MGGVSNHFDNSTLLNSLAWLMKHPLIKRLICTCGPIETPSELYIKLKDLVKQGHCHQALSLYRQIHRSSCDTRHCIATILPSLIKASSLSHYHHVGLQLHCFAIKTASYLDLVVSNSLVSMYAKFFDPKSAHQLFDEMAHRDPISWSSLINCYIQNGHFTRAIDTFKRMCGVGHLPKPELTASVLSVCGREGLIKLGIEIHGFVIASGMVEDSLFLSTAIVDLYTRCGNLQLAFQVFSKMEMRNEVSWTAMIRGFTANHYHWMALDCFWKMQVEGIKPNRVTLISIIPACVELCSMKHAKEIHGYAFRHGFELEPCFSALLMHMYLRFGGARALRIVHIMMEQSPERDVVMWSSIIGAYARDGDIMEAMKHFRKMRLEGIMPNSVTLLEMVSACKNQVSLSNGQAIHCYALKTGLFRDTCVGNSLISMYSNCGCLAESKLIFTEMPARDYVSWDSLIGAHGISGRSKEALQIFHDMEERGVNADSITLLTALTACNHAGLVEEGHELFNKAIEENKIPLGIQHYACQIDLLRRAGRIEEACEILRQMPLAPSVSILSSLVSSCMDHGRLEVAEMLAYELIRLEPENAANYTLLSIVYAKSNDWHSVEAIRRLMRAKGLKKISGFSKIEA